ncbi:MAG: phosphoenolpyruvate carboxylase [Candidatus Bathyarchaeota archaeon]|nr:MAG: phosphoenolpyruvate carboxylase [Candidatus Bathyarchaeota archaeon]
MRKIPVTMATQHADSATKHVLIQEEPDEAILCFKRKDGFGCDEYLVDYMGKLTPYHQVGQIIRKIRQETNFIPGRDVFVTPRIVSSFEEEPFRQLMTVLAIIEGIRHCMQHFKEQGIVEVVQAVTAPTEQLKMCKERCQSLLTLVGKHLHMSTKGMNLRIIPLFGGIAEQLSIQQIVPPLIQDAKIEDDMRLFIGKSEPSLLYGHPASVLSCKIAISSCHKIEAASGVKVYPIFGGGSLPFRGHLTLENASNFLEEYRGVRTYTIQSGMRYDHGLDKTRALIKEIKKGVEKEPLDFDSDQLAKIQQMMFMFAKNYLIELSEIAEKVSMIADYIPAQRDRLLDVEEVAYYRELRNVESILKLCPDKEVRRSILGYTSTAFRKPPRWTNFVAAMYTCGLPPELIGTGSALKEIKETMGEEWVEAFLTTIVPSFKVDIKFASRFLDRDPKHNMLLTRRLTTSIGTLESFVEFAEPDNSYIILSRVATAYIKDMLAGKISKAKKLALVIGESGVAEYLDGTNQENLSRLILDLGRIRKSLA